MHCYYVYDRDNKSELYKGSVNKSYWTCSISSSAAIYRIYYAISMEVKTIMGIVMDDSRSVTRV